MALTFNKILQALDNENFDIDNAGISSDKEDLDRCLESSGDNSRQVSLCF